MVQGLTTNGNLKSQINTMNYQIVTTVWMMVECMTETLTLL